MLAPYLVIALILLWGCDEWRLRGPDYFAWMDLLAWELWSKVYVYTCLPGAYYDQPIHK